LPSESSPFRLLSEHMAARLRVSFKDPTMDIRNV
jgi:hypothetical protein